ncbi:hypothetical protein NQ314_016059 [Rhamnusium bicolor]|uniref:Uncharacterized protein n=1 Tax=Rhamnusium bicolor TaxID=1586634 RepID=A0AAV8WXC5_9CUCU|nr:hypothetical protein NQ314_016059 [Rhamnusium bicolor]
MMRRHEKESAWLESTKIPINNLYQTKQEHSDGILIEGFSNPQFKEVYVNNLFKLQTKSPNNCCQIKDSDIILIRNFATCLRTKNFYYWT